MRARVGTEGSVVVRKNPGYNPGLTKDWLVLDAGMCVGEFDSEAEANTHCEKVIAEKPKKEESELSRRQELQNEYRNTPKREIKKRRRLKAELQIVKAQVGQEKEKGETKPVKKEKSPLTEAYEVLLPKKHKGHYHKGRRGRCSCENPNSEIK